MTPDKALKTRLVKWRNKAYFALDPQKKGKAQINNWCFFILSFNKYIFTKHLLPFIGGKK
jgi:hypothetical protein